MKIAGLLLIGAWGPAALGAAGGLEVSGAKESGQAWTSMGREAQAETNALVTTNLTLTTNVIEFNPVIELDSFPVGDLIERLQAVRREEDREINRQAREQFLAMSNRLQSIEGTLERQRTREIGLLERLHRFTLTIAIAFASVAVMGMVIIGAMLWRSNSRLAEVAMGYGEGRRVPGLARGAGGWELPAGPSSGMGDSGGGVQLTGALAQLEHRIGELEHTARAEPKPVNSGNKSNGQIVTSKPAPVKETDSAAGGREDLQLVLSTILAKGDSQVNLGEYENALQTYMDAEKLSPDNAEVLVKKGVALEKLRQIEDALACYDKAIELDPSMTIAFLHKGRAFNRMSRFDEALECYEKALRTQPHQSI